MPLDLVDIVRQKREEKRASPPPVSALKPTAVSTAPTDPAEGQFQETWKTDPAILRWREGFVKKFGEEPPQDPKVAQYDYRKAVAAGIRPQDVLDDDIPHWDSRFKAADHPDRFKTIGGVRTDTVTGKAAPSGDLVDRVRGKRDAAQVTPAPSPDALQQMLTAQVQADERWTERIRASGVRVRRLTEEAPAPPGRGRTGGISLAPEDPREAEQAQVKHEAWQMDTVTMEKGAPQTLREKAEDTVLDTGKYTREQIEAAGDRELKAMVRLVKHPPRTKMGEQTVEQQLQNARQGDKRALAKGLDPLAEVPPDIGKTLQEELNEQARETRSPEFLARAGATFANRIALEELDIRHLRHYLNDPMIDRILTHRDDKDYLRAKHKKPIQVFGKPVIPWEETAFEVKERYLKDPSTQTARLVRLAAESLRRDATGESPTYAYRMTPPRGLGEKIAGVGGGLLAFVVRIGLTSGIVPPAMKGKTLGTALAWELENTAGPPGEGAVMGAALNTLGKLRKFGKAGAVVGTGATSVAFQQMAAVRGADIEEQMIAALIPPALALIGAIKGKFRARLQAVRNAKQLKVALKGMRGDALETLGFGRNATPTFDEFKAAYRTLVKQTHPDIPGGTTEAFKTVRQAYEFVTGVAAAYKGGKPAPTAKAKPGDITKYAPGAIAKPAPAAPAAKPPAKPAVAEALPAAPQAREVAPGEAKPPAEAVTPAAAVRRAELDAMSFRDLLDLAKSRDLVVDVAAASKKSLTESVLRGEGHLAAPVAPEVPKVAPEPTKRPPEAEIPPRPLIDPHASALKQDKQALAQQRWDKKHGKIPRAEPPAKPPRKPPRKPRAAPVARRLAKEAGIDLSTIEGTGKNGTVTKADVEAAIGEKPVADVQEGEIGTLEAERAALIAEQAALVESGDIRQLPGEQFEPVTEKGEAFAKKRQDWISGMRQRVGMEAQRDQLRAEGKMPPKPAPAPVVAKIAITEPVPAPTVQAKKAKRIISQKAIDKAWKDLGEEMTTLKGGIPLRPKMVKATGIILLGEFESGVRKLGAVIKVLVPKLMKLNPKMTTALATRYVRRAWRDTIDDQHRIVNLERALKKKDVKEARRIKADALKALRKAEKISKPLPKAKVKGVVRRVTGLDYADEASRLLKTKLGAIEQATAVAWVESAKETIKRQKNLAEYVESLLEGTDLTAKQGANLVKWVMDIRTPGEQAKRLAQIEVMVAKSALTQARRELKAVNRKATSKYGRDYRKLRPALRDAMREIGQAIEFKSFTKRQQRTMTKTAAYFREHPDLELPAGAEKAIESLGKRAIAEMSLDDLHAARDGIKAILHQQKLITKLLNRRERRTVAQAAAHIAKVAGQPEVDENGKVVPVSKNWLARSKDYVTQRLETYLLAMDGGKPGLATKLIYDSLRAGTNDFHRLADPDAGTITLRMQGIFKKHGIDLENGLDGWFAGGLKKPVARTIKLPNGSTITTTKGGIISLLMTIRDTEGDGGRALLQNPRGFFLVDAKRKVRMSEYAKALTGADIEAIVAGATPEELAAAKAAREFFDYLAQRGNSVSVRLWGYEKFTNETYWPRHRERADVGDIDETLDVALDYFKSDPVLGWRSTKGRLGGQARLRIHDAFSIIHEHRRHMAMLEALGPPIRDLKLLMGTRGIKQAAKVKIGEKGLAALRVHIRRALSQTVPTRDPLESLAGKARGRASKSILIIHPSVIVAQATSFFHAANEMGPGFLQMLRPLTTAEKRGVAVVKSLKYSPDLYRRKKGFIGRDIGEVMAGREMSRSFNKNPDRLLDKATKPLRRSDQIPVNRIIAYAIKEGQARGLTGSALWRWAAERSEYVVRWTQPAFSPLDRTMLGGATSQAIKMFTMFRSYRDVMLGQLEKAHVEYAHSRKTAKDRAKFYGRVFNSVVINAGVNLVRKNLWRYAKGTAGLAALGLLLGRIESDDEKQAEKAWYSYTADWTQEVLDFLPFAGSAFRKSRAVGRGDYWADDIDVVDSPVLGTLDDAAEAAGMLVRAAAQASADEEYTQGVRVGEKKWIATAKRAAELMGRAAGRLTGVPSDVIADVLKAALVDQEDRAPSRIYSLANASLDDIKHADLIAMRVSVLKDRGITLEQAEKMLDEYLKAKQERTDKRYAKAKAAYDAGEQAGKPKKTPKTKSSTIRQWKARLAARWKGETYKKPVSYAPAPRPTRPRQRDTRPPRED